MTVIDYTCNAIVKQGRAVLICEKPLGHLDDGDPDHRMGEVTWQEETW